jgi:hypothetical protein
MDEITFEAQLDTDTKLYISPVHDHIYNEFVDSDNLGGSSGYFITRENKSGFDILAKASNLEAAQEIYSIICRSIKPA